MAPHYLPSFVRKDSLKRPKLDQQFSSRSQLSLATPTSERGSPFGPDGSPVSSRNKKGSTTTLAERSNSPDGAEGKSGVTLTPGSGFGWGKVIREGRFLSVSTLVGGTKVQPAAPPVEPPAPIRRLDSTSRLAELRELMRAEPEGGLDYYIVPTEDAHQSEYTAPPDRRREFISGFTGSAGTAVISRTGAHLFTDSRYYTQATRELDGNWTLHKVGFTPDIQPWNEWVRDRPRGSRVGIDSRLISQETAAALQSGLHTRYSKLVFPRVNLVDKVWKTRPAKPQGEAFYLDAKFTGKSAAQKLEELRSWIRSQRPPAPPAVTTAQRTRKTSTSTAPPVSPTKDAKSGKDKAKESGSEKEKEKPKSPTVPKPPMAPVATFVSSLANIAWLLNLRGSDVLYNPVLTSYLFVTTKQAILFVDKAKITPEVNAYLKEQGVSTREYGDVWAFLRRAEWGDGKVLINPKTPYAVSLMLTSARYMLAPCFIEQQKAVKNDVEIAGFKNAYARDGAAYVKWLAWLDEQMRAGAQITEWEAGEELTHYREEGAHFWGLAYENISATGPNAALPHYTADEESAAMIDPNTPYLNDSGGQYFDGTCDTTRTVHFGFPTSEQMEAYTRVLQGHIAIDSAVFPEGTTGKQLDVLARKALWQDGLNYGHGTGHGIGAFLNVHEGPHGFGIDVPLRPGNIITNEPGFYKEGSFGVRIESALVVKRVETKNEFGGAIWLGFERLTQVPIQLRMVKMDMLTKEEKLWLKNHNNTVREKLSPLLGNDKRALRYVRRESTKSGPAVRGGVNLEWD